MFRPYQRSSGVTSDSLFFENLLCLNEKIKGALMSIVL